MSDPAPVPGQEQRPSSPSAPEDRGCAAVGCLVVALPLGYIFLSVFEAFPEGWNALEVLDRIGNWISAHFGAVAAGVVAMIVLGAIVGFKSKELDTPGLISAIFFTLVVPLIISYLTSFF